MKKFSNKIVIGAFLVIALFIFYIIVKPSNYIENDEKIQIKDFDFQMSEGSYRFASIITVPFTLTNLKDENQELKPSESFKLIGDGKEIPMIEIGSTPDRVDIMTVGPEAIMLMDMKFETNEEIDEYILQVRDKKLFKDKLYEFDITEDIKKFGR